MDNASEADSNQLIVHAQEYWNVHIERTQPSDSTWHAFLKVLTPVDEIERFRRHVESELEKNTRSSFVTLTSHIDKMETADVMKRVMRIEDDYQPHQHEALQIAGRILIRVHTVDELLYPLVFDRLRDDPSFRGLMDAIWAVTSRGQLPSKFLHKGLAKHGLASVVDTYSTRESTVSLRSQTASPEPIDLVIDYVSWNSTQESS